MDTVLSGGVGVSRWAKIFVLNLAVNVYHILILIELLDLWIDGVGGILLLVDLYVVLLLYAALASGVAVTQVIESIFSVLVLNW